MFLNFISASLFFISFCHRGTGAYFEKHFHHEDTSILISEIEIGVTSISGANGRQSAPESTRGGIT